VLESQARKWAQEPNVTPALLTIYSWTNERPQHSESRRIYGNAAQKALGLAWAARVLDSREYAQHAANVIRAWMAVPLDGPDVNFVSSDTSTVFIQAADLIRRSGVWTQQDDQQMNTFMVKEIEARLPEMAQSSRQRARWRAVSARMLMAGWHGDTQTIREQMQILVADCAESITPASLRSLGAESEGTILHTMSQAIMAADIARAAGVVSDPPANFRLALQAIVAEIDGGKDASRRHLEIDPLITGRAPWRLPATSPIKAGPRPLDRLAFGWYIPTFMGLDPRDTP
jgi:hypothetical protein